MKATVVATLALSALAVCAGAFYSQKTRADAREAALKQELTRLSRRVDSLDSAQQSAMNNALLERATRANTVVAFAPAAPSAAERPVALATAGDPATPEERKAKAEERRAERARALDDFLRTDGIDKPWSDGMVAAAYQAVDAAKSGHLIKADCGSRLCRIVVDHPGLTEQRSFAAHVSESTPFDNGIFFRYDRSGSRPQTTMYVAREGTELASLIPPS